MELLQQMEQLVKLLQQTSVHEYNRSCRIRQSETVEAAATDKRGGVKQ